MLFLVEALHTSIEMPYFCDMIRLHYELFHQHLTQYLNSPNFWRIAYCEVDGLTVYQTYATFP